MRDKYELSVRDKILATVFFSILAIVLIVTIVFAFGDVYAYSYDNLGGSYWTEKYPLTYVRPVNASYTFNGYIYAEDGMVNYTGTITMRTLSVSLPSSVNSYNTFLSFDQISDLTMSVDRDGDIFVSYSNLQIEFFDDNITYGGSGTFSTLTSFLEQYFTLRTAPTPVTTTISSYEIPVPVQLNDTTPEPDNTISEDVSISIGDVNNPFMTFNHIDIEDGGLYIYNLTDGLEGVGYQVYMSNGFLHVYDVDTGEVPDFVSLFRSLTFIDPVSRDLYDYLVVATNLDTTNDSYRRAYNQGLFFGYLNTVDVSYQPGYDAGYQEGYDDGVEADLGGTFFSDLLSAPYNALSSMVIAEFTIGGNTITLSIWTVVSTFIVLILVFVLLKLFLGG